MVCSALFFAVVATCAFCVLWIAPAGHPLSIAPLFSSHLISSSRSPPKRIASFANEDMNKDRTENLNMRAYVSEQSTERQSASNATENKIQQETLATVE